MTSYSLLSTSLQCPASERCGPSELLYDHSLVTSSVVQEFDLVCQRSYLKSVVNCLYMLGALVGSYLFGWISDKSGRMNSLIVACLTCSLSGCLGWEKSHDICHFQKQSFKGFLWRQFWPVRLRYTEILVWDGRHRGLCHSLRAGSGARGLEVHDGAGSGHHDTLLHGGGGPGAGRLLGQRLETSSDRDSPPSTGWVGHH